MPGPRYISYLLRLWQTGDDHHSVWRSSLEAPGSGEKQGFANLSELFHFLEEQTGEVRLEEQSKNLSHPDKRGIRLELGENFVVLPEFEIQAGRLDTLILSKEGGVIFVEIQALPGDLELVGNRYQVGRDPRQLALLQRLLSQATETGRAVGKFLGIEAVPVTTILAVEASQLESKQWIQGVILVPLRSLVMEVAATRQPDKSTPAIWAKREELVGFLKGV